MAQPTAPSSNRRSTSTPPGNEATYNAGAGASFLTKYFLVILFGFACLSLALNSRFTQIVVQDVSIIESVLKNSMQQLSTNTFQQQHPVLDDDRTRQEEHQPDDVPKENVKATVNKQQKRQDDNGDHSQQEHPDKEAKEHVKAVEITPQNSQNDNVHKIANLNCDAYGGPSKEAAQEMVYWEDIPQDAEYMSPFHRKRRDSGKDKMSLTQFMTFEPDFGGWNNIRMAMGT
jgi:hypothetical protein